MIGVKVGVERYAEQKRPPYARTNLSSNNAPFKTNWNVSLEVYRKVIRSPFKTLAYIRKNSEFVILASNFFVLHLLKTAKMVYIKPQNRICKKFALQNLLL